MATWVEVQESVRLAIAGCLRLPDVLGIDGVTANHLVEYENRVASHRFLTPGSPWCDLSLTAVTAHGRGETVYEFQDGGTPATSKSVPTYGGYRTFSILIKVCAFSQEAGSEAVGALCAGIRTRIHRDDILSITQAANVALVTVGSTRMADFMDANGRMVSCAWCDVTFATTEADTDQTVAGDYVATVEVSGTLSNAGQQLEISFEGP